jgi:hypothetical protein
VKRLLLEIREWAWVPILAVLVALTAIVLAVLDVPLSVIVAVVGLAVVLAFLSLKE